MVYTQLCKHCFSIFRTVKSHALVITYLALKPQDSIPVPLLSGHSLLILDYIFEHKLRCNKEYQIVNNQQLDLIDSSKQVAG